MNIIQTIRIEIPLNVPIAHVIQFCNADLKRKGLEDTISITLMQNTITGRIVEVSAKAPESFYTVGLIIGAEIRKNQTPRLS